MTECIDLLAQTMLFAGIAPVEIAELLGCLHARRVSYAKGDMVIEEGSCVREFGVLLSGRARSIKWDANDKLIIITLLAAGS